MNEHDDLTIHMIPFPQRPDQLMRGYRIGLNEVEDRLQAMMASSTTRFADLPGLQTAIFLIQKLKEENHES